MDRGDPSRKQRPKAASASAAAVTRKVDTTGHVSYAGAYYKVSASLKTQAVQVAVVRRQAKKSFYTKKEAQAALTTMLASHQTVTFAASSRRTIAELVDPWIDSLDIQGRPSTATGE